MSRIPTQSDLAKSSAPEAAPLAQTETQEKGIVGSAFRLDAMSPGTDSDAAGLSAPKKPNVLVQLGFFAVLICAAGGLIYSMRKMGIGPLKSFAAAKMPDYDVTKGSATNADHQKVLNELSRATSTAQVPADQVQKNPFRLADSLGSSEDDAAEDAKKSEAQRMAAQARAKKEAEARAKAVENKLNTIKIHSIMNGSNPVARVNDQFVRVGDLIDETFAVKAINERSIEIDAEGVTYLLSLDEQPSQKGAPKRKK